MTSFETPNGKRIELFIDPKTAHVRIKFVPGGELPEELSGLFTSERAASSSIMQYLGKIKVK